MTQKTRIDGATINSNTKLFLKTQIDDLLILLLLAQFTYMKILTLSSEIYNFVPEIEIYNIEDDLSKLTIDTKKFIERLGTNEREDYPYPNFIKNRVKKSFYNKKVLPNVLNCDISFILRIPISITQY
jgi:hypothetical protein